MIHDRMIYLVVCRHHTGNFLPERETADLDRATTVRQIAEGQFSNVAQVIELNPVEHTSRDVSEDIAREVMTIWAHRGEPLADQQVDFIEQHVSIGAARSFQRAA